jgi:TPR repeat protein
MEAYNDSQPDLAFKMMEECAQEGDPVACYMAALWSREGDGIPANPERSEHWMAELEQIAASGNAEAQWELGQHYRFGDLWPEDITQANSWLEQAAANGCAEAQHHLGWYLETGQYGYEIDAAAARAWYEKALKQQHPETLYLFAMKHFRDGKPTQEAIELLKKAAAGGLLQAADILRTHTH